MKKDEVLVEAAIKSAIDTDIMKRAYYGLVKAIVKGLRENGTVNLPDWGKFTIVEYQKQYPWAKGKVIPTKVVKFSATKSLKFYIKNMV